MDGQTSENTESTLHFVVVLLGFATNYNRLCFNSCKVAHECWQI